MPFRRLHADYGLDAAVRDALVTYGTPRCSIITGFLVGVTTVVGVPFLLFYHACILQPAALAGGRLPDISPFPGCLSNLAPANTALLLIWPYLFGLIGALYGYLRYYHLRGELRWRQKIAWMRPYHFLALMAGYLAFAFTVWVSRSALLVVGTPLLAAVSGPSMLVVWVFVHNRFLYFVTKPNWSRLVAQTVLIWFPRRLGVAPDAIISACAHHDGLLEVYADITPEMADQARLLATALPGINRVEIYNSKGDALKTGNANRLTSLVEAGRIVAQLRRQRAKMWASGGYTARHEVIYDHSGRLLLITVSVVTASLMLSLLWVAMHGGFHPITAADLQWFFGKYGAASMDEVRTLPKSMRPFSR